MLMLKNVAKTNLSKLIFEIWGMCNLCCRTFFKKRNIQEFPEGSWHENASCLLVFCTTNLNSSILFWYADSQVKVHQALVCSALHAKPIRTPLQPSNTCHPTKHHSADLWRMYNSQEKLRNELFSVTLFTTLSSLHLPKYKQITDWSDASCSRGAKAKDQRQILQRWLRSESLCL